jgi:hypothetical protein
MRSMDRTFSAYACCRCGSGLVQAMDGTWSCPTPTARLPNLDLVDDLMPMSDKPAEWPADAVRHTTRLARDLVAP